MILTAGILALTSSLLTALGMAELFQGLFIIFLIIDLGRFLVLNFVVDEWKNLRAIKWIITIILGILFIYSAVGVYNKLTTMIPESVQVAMVEAATYNKTQDNAEIKQNRSENLAEVAQAEYQKAIDWNAKDYENCIKRANEDPNAENKCNNTKRRLDNNASKALKEAMKNADAALDNAQTAVTQNTKNQSEIAGVLTTVCRILPNTDCKTYEGLQTALTVIILLVICGLDYLQLSIVLAVNTRKNKKDQKEEIAVEKEIVIEEPTVKKKRNKKKKNFQTKEVVKGDVISEKIEEPKTEAEEAIQEPAAKVIEKTEKISKKDQKKTKKPKKKRSLFSQITDFYK